MPRFSIRLARKIFKDSFEQDDGFRIAYQANIAMLLHDRYGITDIKKRNEAANEIMAVIFDAKNIQPMNFDTENKIENRWGILDL